MKIRVKNRNDRGGDRGYGRDRSERRSDRGGEYSRRDDRDRGNSNKIQYKLLIYENINSISVSNDYIYD